MRNLFPEFQLNPKINDLRNSSVFFGTSSWKYEGWKGLIYRQSYPADKAFNEKALNEYSEHFSSVGVDHTYYAWPTEKQMTKYYESTPPGFQFVLKATEKVTVFRYPRLPRYGKDAGTTNDSFLNAELFQEQFLNPVSSLKEKLGAIIFEFSTFHPGMIEKGSVFVERLSQFLEKIKKASSVPLAVEIRNSNWLVPQYFEMLIQNQVAHVFNSWTHMPAIADQWDKAKLFDLPFYILRLLLKPGVLYQEAVDSFSPYDRLHQELTDTRLATAALIREALKKTKKTYVLVNNRFEGCAPKTIEAILQLI